jgi:hypothetical protein
MNINLTLNLVKASHIDIQCPFLKGIEQYSSIFKRKNSLNITQDLIVIEMSNIFF